MAHLTANQIYEQLVEEYGEESFPLFIQGPAPPVAIAFLLGAILLIVCILLMIRRYRNIVKVIEERFGVEEGDLPESVYSRVLLVAAMDDGDTLYSLAFTTGTSFLLLGGFQTAYNTTYFIMIGAYALFACMDVAQVVWTFSEYGSLRDLVVTAKDYKETEDDHEEIKQATVTFTPSNVYQNFAINGLVVGFFFITQLTLMACVAIDLIFTKLNNCIDFDPNNEDPHDKVEGCPTVGTFISWLLYVLGIFLLNTFLLGPGRSGGDGQFDTNHWAAILLGAKKGGIYSWRSPFGFGLKGGKIKTCNIRNDDLRLYFRFLAGAIVNSFGFRLLLNSLPILLAGKTTIFRVLFQAMGVIYIAKLDDASGFSMEFAENPVEKEYNVQERPYHGTVKSCETGKFLPNIYKKKLS